jgi:hypothetical protein
MGMADLVEDLVRSVKKFRILGLARKCFRWA